MGDESGPRGHLSAGRSFAPGFNRVQRGGLRGSFCNVRSRKFTKHSHGGINNCANSCCRQFYLVLRIAIHGLNNCSGAVCTRLSHLRPSPSLHRPCLPSLRRHSYSSFYTPTKISISAAPIYISLNFTHSPPEPQTILIPSGGLIPESIQKQQPCIGK